MAAHENIKQMMIKNKQVTTAEGKMKIVDTSWSKAMVSSIIVVVNSDNSIYGEVELKVHNEIVYLSAASQHENWYNIGVFYRHNTKSGLLTPFFLAA